MEAIGQLAAGVAHDFNYILTVIQGNAGLLIEIKSPESSERKPLQAIIAAAERASKLVRQLLTFSRKQFLQLRTLEVRDTIGAVSEMLPRMLGEQIMVRVLAPAGLPQVEADASMMEQMLLNLAVNARDAMPNGGLLTLTAAAVEVSAESARSNPDTRPGRFLCLSVADTGTGIAPEVLPHIFEPFFTTKAIGKGTGLGLATVYGIARQHHGWVEVESQLGQGSTFRVFLPAIEKKPDAPATLWTDQPVRGGNETILVVEDEEDVRDFVVEVLKAYGYTVCSAVSGAKALQEWKHRAAELDLVLTDMVMPGGVSGRALAEGLLEEKPTLKVLYTSGYSPGIAGRDIALLEGRNFLAKPYRPALLLQTIRECLDQRETGKH
jgi:CheY-like chemotaxis protein